MNPSYKQSLPLTHIHTHSLSDFAPSTHVARSRAPTPMKTLCHMHTGSPCANTHTSSRDTHTSNVFTGTHTFSLTHSHSYTPPPHTHTGSQSLSPAQDTSGKTAAAVLTCPSFFPGPAQQHFPRPTQPSLPCSLLLTLSARSPCP